MATWRVGDETIRRKNLYMPCALGPRFDEADAATRAQLLRETYWADNITNAEWPVVLGDPGSTAVNRSG